MAPRVACIQLAWTLTVMNFHGQLVQLGIMRKIEPSQFLSLQGAVASLVSYVALIQNAILSFLCMHGLSFVSGRPLTPSSSLNE